MRYLSSGRSRAAHSAASASGSFAGSHSTSCTLHPERSLVGPERHKLYAVHIGSAYPMLHRVTVLVRATGVRVNIVIDAGETHLNRHSFRGLVTRQGGPADGIKTQPERVESVTEDGSQSPVI